MGELDLNATKKFKIHGLTFWELFVKINVENTSVSSSQIYCDAGFRIGYIILAVDSLTGTGVQTPLCD